MSNLYRLESVNDIAIELIARDYEKGYLSYEGMPLPVLYDEAYEVTSEIYDYLQRVFKIEYDKGLVSKKQRDYQVLYYSMLWSAFAGIGAAELWEREGSRLLKKGVIKSLVKEKGLFSMDEYVLNMVTQGLGAEQKEKLRNRIIEHIRPEAEHMLKAFHEELDDRNSLIQSFKRFCEGIYVYGLVIQEEIMGNI